MKNRRLIMGRRIGGLIASLVTCATVGACSGPPDDDGAETEGEEVGVSGDPLSSLDCRMTNAKGYRYGHELDIEVVTIDAKKVEWKTANAYMRMAKAAAEDGVQLRIVSGFRTMAQQKYLYHCYTSCSCNSCNLAAKPGYSNHQSGHALDLNTSSNGVYGWLHNHAGEFGFKRTVPSEIWHWEWWGNDHGHGPCNGDDKDGDGSLDAKDNCPIVKNAGQIDTDHDDRGDACDSDDDGDGVKDAADNCQKKKNPQQLDSDADGRGDVCDGSASASVLGLEDSDQDGLPDTLDLCPELPDSVNLDTDEDGIGDACDDDLDGDGKLDATGADPIGSELDEPPPPEGSDLPSPSPADEAEDPSSDAGCQTSAPGLPGGSGWVVGLGALLIVARRRLSCLAGALLLALMSSGCAGDSDPSEDDLLAGDEAVGSEEVGSSEEEIVAACHRYDTIYPQTRDKDRWILERALSWVDDRVMYSQVERHQGYRKDCSGLISMAWDLKNTKPGLVTWTLDERSHEIAWQDLRPGDALVVPHHHAFLFAGWANEAHTQMCAIEEYDYGHPAEITLRSRADAKQTGYQPIRRDR